MSRMAKAAKKADIKASKQLGMNKSTASHRLVKDLLWMLIEETGKNICSRCEKVMNRESFSIEHNLPWRDSDNPKNLFFDLTNISFSHISCNSSAARRPGLEYLNDAHRRKVATERILEKRKLIPREERKKKRGEDYLKYGH